MWFCLLSFYIFFALFSSSSHDRNFNQLCSIGDACCDWMMTGGSGYISGGSVEERGETSFSQGHSSSWGLFHKTSLPNKPGLFQLVCTQKNIQA